MPWGPGLAFCRVPRRDLMSSSAQGRICNLRSRETTQSHHGPWGCPTLCLWDTRLGSEGGRGGGRLQGSLAASGSRQPVRRAHCPISQLRKPSLRAATAMEQIWDLNLCAVLSCFSHVQLFSTLWTISPARLLCSWDSPGKNTGLG